MTYQNIVLQWRRFVRKLNWWGIFWETDPMPAPTLVVAGYTRSGTTYTAEILASVMKARYVHEPLDSKAVGEISFFHAREAATTIHGNAKYMTALRSVFGPALRGNDRGHRFLYRGDRIVKIVRGNFYLHILSDLFPETKICLVVRNPASAIASRIRLGFDVPDHSKCLVDIEHQLTTKQRKMINSLKGTHGQMALGWCFDNLVALKNMGNENFLWIHYEDLILDPFKQIKGILEFIDKTIPDERIRKEVDLYGHGAPRKATRLIRGWEGVLESTELDDIAAVVDAFGLSYLYYTHTGLPKHAFAAMKHS